MFAVEMLVPLVLNACKSEPVRPEGVALVCERIPVAKCGGEDDEDCEGFFFKYEGKHEMATENTTLRCWNHDAAEWL
jgi:hypothetical protein